MERINRWMVVALMIITSLQLAACSPAPLEASKIQPAKVEPIEGSNLSRVVLTEQAAERLDIQTAPVREQEVSGKQRQVIPYAAVLYDPQGNTWAYTNPEPLTFVRQPISVDHIEGDMAVLSDGLPSGAVVVTVGAAELFGSESEFKEE
jgi:hypothetical protein